MRIITLLIVLVIATTCYAESDPFPQNRGTVYDYGDNIPDICFFGEGAKWDGSKLASDDWFKLTDFLKTMFIIEGGEELGYDGFNGWAVLTEMNQVANDTPNSVNMIDVLKVILLRDYVQEKKSK